MAFHSLAAGSARCFGALNVHGPDGVRFYPDESRSPRVGRTDSRSYRSSVCRLSVNTLSGRRRLWASLLSTAVPLSREISTHFPSNAGWEYVGFDVWQLKAGESITLRPMSVNICLVLVAGLRVSVKPPTVFLSDWSAHESV